MRRWAKDDVKAAVTLSRVLVDLTGEQPRQRGRELAGRCPFHDDRTPSLRINDEKDGGVWHCDPCSKEGASDAQTLWRHDVPALGLPSASTKLEEYADLLAGIDRIEVAIEPDQRGRQCWQP